MNANRTRRGRGRPRLTDERRQPDRVQALDRGLTVFALVSQEGRCTLTELAAMAGMAPSTAHRMLETLRAHDLVAFDMYSQTWSIGAEAFRIGHGYARQADYLEVARTLMRRLVAQTGETASVAVAEGREVVYVSQIETHAPIRAFIPPGTRGPLHVSGIGKALLACMPEAACRQSLSAHTLASFTDNTITDVDRLLDELERIRARGWAIDDEERYRGMRCLAAPIFNEFGEAIAGLSISGPTVRLDDTELERHGSTIRAAADEVTAMIGGLVPPRWQLSRAAEVHRPDIGEVRSGPTR